MPGSRRENGIVTSDRGPIRSTNTITADGVDLTGDDVLQTNTVSSTTSGDITVCAVARSTEIKPYEPLGQNLSRRSGGVPAADSGQISLGIAVDG